MKSTTLQPKIFDNLNINSSADHLLSMLKVEVMKRPWARTSGVISKKGRKSLFEHKPATTEEFFNKYYSEVNYPRQQKLMDAIFGTDPYQWDSTYGEFIALWGMGSGKDHTIAKAFTYAAYWLNCLYDPQAYFGRGRGTAIDLVNFCINGYLAKTVFFNDFKNIIVGTIDPSTSENWFVKRGMDVREGHDIQTKTIQFPKRVFAHSLDSQHESGVGLHVLLAVFDEIGGFAYSDAQKIYDNITSTAVSRFKENAKDMLISWPRDVNDFMMVKYETEKKRQESEKTRVWIDKGATWEVNLGTKQEDFASKFATNPESSNRVYKCIVKIGENAYYKYKELIRYCINYKHLNPVKNNRFRIFNRTDLIFKDWFRGLNNVWYYGHADLAKGKEGGDACGISLSHNVRGMPIKVDEEYIEKLKEEIGIDVSSYFAKGKTGHGVCFDLLLQIRAVKGREVMFQDIIDIFTYLKRKRGFDIKVVTYDGWQSVGEIQRMKDSGIESEVFSLDKGTKGHDTLKSLIYRGLADYYPHPIFIREAEELMIDKKKVNHPEKSTKRFIQEGTDRGSKDVVDAAAGSAYTAMERYSGGVSAWWDDMVSFFDEVINKNMLRPEQQEYNIMSEIRRRTEENERKFKQMMDGPIVTRGERPDVDESY